jgi:glutamine amidotransferase
VIVIVDYGSGNLGSVRSLFSKVGAEATVSGKVSDVASASKLILPGVGAFDHAMSRLTELGLVSCLKQRAMDGVPLLGICLGMQLLSDGSDEGDLPGLGLITGRFHKFVPDKAGGVRVPHVGWNSVRVVRQNPLLDQNVFENRFYFVHSYFFPGAATESQIAVTSYGVEFTSVYGVGNTFGCQFHPEKSHKFGVGLVQRFLRL